MPDINWNGSSGEWTDSTNWTPQQVPGSADIAVVSGGSAADVLIGGSDSVVVSGLVLNDASGTVEVDGVLSAANIALSAGTIVDDGTIAGATLVINGGSIDFGYGLLQADTIVGTLDVSGADAVVQSGLTVENADSTPGTITIDGADSTLLFNDNETFDNATIIIGSTSGLDGLDAGGTLTLGAGVLVETAATFASDTLGGNGTIINDGSILVDAASGTVSLESPSFINNGSITVTGGADLDIQPYGTFSNNGRLAISDGGTIAIQYLNAFTNTGSLQIGSGSELDLDTYASTLTQAQTVGGTIEIDGLLNASGETIDITPTGAFSELDNYGTIENAVLVLSGGTLGLTSGSVFQNDTIVGALTIGDGDTVIVQSGFAITNADGTPGTISLTGADATLEVADAETIDNATIVIGNASDLDTLQVDNVLTLGAGAVVETAASITTAMITGAGTVINGGTILADGTSGTLVLETTDFDNEGTLIVAGGEALNIEVFGTFANDGRIAISAGSTVTLQDASAFTNTGSIQVGSGAELNLYDYAPDMSQGQTVGGTLEIDGIVDAGGNTISVDSAGAFSELDNYGTLENATLILNGGTLGLTSGSVFQNDTIVGALTIGDSDTVVVQSGFAITNADGTPGTISLTGADATLEVADAETIDNATIVIGNASDLDTLQVDNVLTLGAGAVVETAASSITTAMITGAGTVINNGTILTDGTSGTLVLETTDFDNEGTLIVAGGEALNIEVFGTFANDGRIAISAGSTVTLQDASAFTNTGSIQVGSGAELNLYDYAPDMSQGQTVGGTLEIDGIVDAGGNTISVDSAGAFSELDNYGTLENATLILNGGTLGLTSGSVFQNDTIVGALTIGDSDTVVVQSGFAITNADGTPGTISLTGADATLEVADAETIDNATIVIGNASDLDTLQVDNVLTLGAGAVVETAASITTAMITGAGTVINGGTILADGTSGTLVLETTDFDNEGTLIVAGGEALNIEVFDTFANDGRIAISAGSTVTLQDASAFTNTGSIQVGSGAELNLYDYAPDMSQGQTVGGTLEIDGIVDAGGNTISVDSAGAFSELDNYGTLENATLILNGGTLGLTSGSVFQNDTIVGALTIGDSDTVVVQSGFAIENVNGGAGGSILLTGADATLEIADAETIAGATITMGSADDVTTLDVDSTLTLTSATTIEATSSFTSNAITGAGTVINDGTVAADAASGNLVIGTTDFTNAGLVAVAGGASLAIQTYDAFDNSGMLSITSGSTATVNSVSTFSNTGTIVLNDGSLTVNALLQGAAGVTQISNGGALELGAGASADQTITFLNNNGSLILDDEADFAATVTGFQSGDTIELAGFAGATESFANGVLTFTKVGTALGQTITTTGTIKLEGSYTAGDFSTTTDADGDLILTTDVLPCFVTGTRILTARGEVAVEDLQVGDDVVTVTDGEQRTSPIRWIGRRAVDIGRHPAPEKVRPVRVLRDAFGATMPMRDLLLSPDHAIFAEGVLVPIKYLVNGETVRVEETAKAVEYFHVELDRHEVLLSDGLSTESYLDSGGRAMFENGGLPVELHADFSHIAWDVLGCAPLKVTGPEVELIRDRLAAGISRPADNDSVAA